MKKFLSVGFLIFVSGLLALVFQTSATAQISNNQTKNPADSRKKSIVLLELFTSEGCPTCPPADANLAFLEKEQPVFDVEIVTLALHVDYWNSVDWKDKYSSPIFSRRQQLYSQALKLNQSYTPQMVVDGRAEFVGNNLAKAQKTLIEAAKMQKATIEITPVADKFKIKISNVPAHENASVFLAVVEDNLTSNRKGGTNANKNPALVSVVRNLSSLGMLTAAQTDLEIETALQIQPDWTRENLKIVVFVQENMSRRILGVSKKSLI